MQYNSPINWTFSYITITPWSHLRKLTIILKSKLQLIKFSLFVQKINLTTFKHFLNFCQDHFKLLSNLLFDHLVSSTLYGKEYPPTLRKWQMRHFQEDSKNSISPGNIIKIQCCLNSLGRVASSIPLYHFRSS